MASTAAQPNTTADRGNTRFFTIMAVVMSTIIVAGFSLNLAMGRSSFNVPWAYHVHGIIFMSWIGLYLAQHLPPLPAIGRCIASSANSPTSSSRSWSRPDP